MKAYLKKYKWALCLLVIFAALCWVYKTHYSTKSYPTVLTYHAIEEKLPEETSEENEYLFVRPADLEEQLQLLTRKGYEFCFASQYEITNKKQVILTLDDGYEDNYTNLFPLLKKYQAKATISVVTGSIGQPGILTADQIREMSDSGLVEFASHTVTHPHLTSLDDAALDQELQASKHALEEITGKDVQAIAYPYSDYDQRVCTAAAKYYRFGYIDWPKNYYAQYEIGRTPVRRDITIEQFEALLH